MAYGCSGARQHSQAVPDAEQMPCPNWVIFIAVQFHCGSARIRFATTEVFPMLRECPPTTTSISSEVGQAPSLRRPLRPPKLTLTITARCDSFQLHHPPFQ